jgi:hypothetical protein
MPGVLHAATEAGPVSRRKALEAAGGVSREQGRVCAEGEGHACMHAWQRRTLCMHDGAHAVAMPAATSEHVKTGYREARCQEGHRESEHQGGTAGEQLPQQPGRIRMSRRIATRHAL